MNRPHSAEASRIVELVGIMRGWLAGESPMVQSAVLADLLATFLSGHVILDDEAATDALREEHLLLHLDLVRQLIPVNYQMLVEPKLKEQGLI